MKWPVSQLGDHIDLLSGFAFPSEGFNEEDGIPIVRIRDVVRGSTATRFRGQYDPTYMIQTGDTLIGMDGQFNVGIWRGGSALLNQRVCRITARDSIDRGFLYHFLPQALKEIEDATPFVTVKHLSVKDIRAIRLSLPPIEEQRRIAAILDQAEALRAKRRQALAKLDTLTQSIFLEMFEKQAEDANARVSLEEVSVRITDGTHQPPKWSAEGHPFLFVSNIVNGKITFDTEKFISEATYKELTRNRPIELGDVLYTTVGSYGNAAVVRDNRKFSFQRHIAQIKPNRAVMEPLFLAAMLNSPFVRRQADKLVRGIAQKTLNLNELRSIQVITPPKSLQAEFLRRLDSLEATTDASSTSLCQLYSLNASLQHRAFRGEL